MAKKHVRQQINQTRKLLEKLERMRFATEQDLRLIRKMGGKEHDKLKQKMKTVEHQINQTRLELKELQRREKQADLKVKRASGMRKS